MELYNILKINNVDINDIIGGGGDIDEIKANTLILSNSINDLNTTYYKTTTTDSNPFNYNLHTSLTLQNIDYKNTNITLISPYYIKNCTFETMDFVSIKCKSFTSNQVSSIIKHFNLDCVEITRNKFSFVRNVNISAYNLKSNTISELNGANFSLSDVYNNTFSKNSNCNVYQLDYMLTNTLNDNYCFNLTGNCISTCSCTNNTILNFVVRQLYSIRFENCLNINITCINITYCTCKLIRNANFYVNSMSLITITNDTSNENMNSNIFMKVYNMFNCKFYSIFQLLISANYIKNLTICDVKNLDLYGDSFISNSYNSINNLYLKCSNINSVSIKDITNLTIICENFIGATNSSFEYSNINYCSICAKNISNVKFVSIKHLVIDADIISYITCSKINDVNVKCVDYSYNYNCKINALNISLENQQFITNESIGFINLTFITENNNWIDTNNIKFKNYIKLTTNFTTY